MSFFVDANIFIRFFTADDEEQCAAAERLLRAGQEGETSLITGPPVFFETAWVLGYRYKLSRAEILDVLESMLTFPGLRVRDAGLVLAAITLARSSDSDFADAYIAASAREAGAEAVATFNKRHFIKLGIPICEEL